MRISFWPDANQTWKDVLSLAKHVEAKGWDGIWYADHFMPEAEDTSEDCNEMWSTLAGLAAMVPRLRIGSMVSCNTYRHPAVLAKIAATVDNISDGRLVLGIGAGWQENEHYAYGLELPTLGGRMQRMEEACQILKALFTNRRSDYNGRHYQLVDAPLEPKPVQDPLPLLIGGGGEKVTLRITAQYADEWHVWGDVATFIHKSAVLDRHCENVGRDPSTIARSTCALVHLSDDAKEVARMNAQPQDYVTIAGNPAQISETLAGYAEAGCDEFLLPDFNLAGGTAKLDVLDRFYEEVGRHFQ